jgi:putative serine/threonine protein kinase
VSATLEEIASRNEDPPYSQRVSVSELSPEVHGSVLCYPGKVLESFEHRKKQLEGLGVREIIFEGQSKIGNLGVVGKGCVSIVVKAVVDNRQGPVALKIRRVDGNRPNMFHDYEMQRLANSVGVGPKAIAVSDDFFAMEYIAAARIGMWIESLNSKSSKKETRSLVRQILLGCFKLDEIGVDHGELSNPSKHILIPPKSKEPVIIDYESASLNRKPANLTSVAQFLFLGSWKGERILKLVLPRDLGNADSDLRQELLRLLRDYKKSPNQSSLHGILKFVHC